MLSVENLSVSLLEKGVPKKTLVDNVSLKIEPASTTAIVGESGSGKSLTAYSLINLLPSDNLKITSGKVIFKGTDVLSLDKNELRRIRGAEIFMIPQDPLTALNPVLTIENQIAELYLYHTNFKKKEIREKVLSILEKVKISSPEARLRAYPHQLSGGERQRVLIGLSVALNTSLIVADEPTTALDVSLQVDILELLMKIQEEKKTALLIITHDFGVVRMIAKHIYVMYGGKIVESGVKEEILDTPIHPYTIGLLKSVPSITSIPKTPLPVIKGYAEKPKYFCPFFERCNIKEKDCQQPFDYVSLTPTHFVLCRKGLKC